MKYHFVYKTTNLITGQYYIGVHSTNNLNDSYLGSGKNIMLAIKDYGKKNFKREILFSLNSRQEAIKKEKETIAYELKKDIRQYNLTFNQKKMLIGLI